jgi:hypothetical protein
LKGQRIGNAGAALALERLALAQRRSLEKLVDKTRARIQESFPDLKVVLEVDVKVVDIRGLQIYLPSIDAVIDYQIHAKWQGTESGQRASVWVAATLNNKQDSPNYLGKLMEVSALEVLEINVDEAANATFNRFQLIFESALDAIEQCEEGQPLTCVRLT